MIIIEVVQNGQTDQYSYYHAKFLNLKVDFSREIYIFRLSFETSLILYLRETIHVQRLIDDYLWFLMIEKSISQEPCHD